MLSQSLWKQSQEVDSGGEHTHEIAISFCRSEEISKEMERYAWLDKQRNASLR